MFLNLCSRIIELMSFLMLRRTWAPRAVGAWRWLGWSPCGTSPELWVCWCAGILCCLAAMPTCCFRQTICPGRRAQHVSAPSGLQLRAPLCDVRGDALPAPVRRLQRFQRELRGREGCAALGPAVHAANVLTRKIPVWFAFIAPLTSWCVVSSGQVFQGWTQMGCSSKYFWH